MKYFELSVIFFNLLWLPIWLAREEGDRIAKWFGGITVFVWIPVALLLWGLNYL